MTAMKAHSHSSYIMLNFIHSFIVLSQTTICVIQVAISYDRTACIGKILNIFKRRQHFPIQYCQSLKHSPPLFHSGNVIIETQFFDDDLLVSTSQVRLFYV